MDTSKKKDISEKMRIEHSRIQNSTLYRKNRGKWIKKDAMKYILSNMKHENPSNNLK